MTLPACNCGATRDLAPCENCHAWRCPKCRYGLGGLDDEYFCVMGCTVQAAFPAPVRNHVWQRVHTNDLLWPLLRAVIVAIGLFALYYFANSCSEHYPR